MAYYTQHDPLDASMAGSGIPSGAQAVPGGPMGGEEDEDKRGRYGALSIWGAMAGRGYSGMVYSNVRDLRGVGRGFKKRYSGLKDFMGRGGRFEDIAFATDRGGRWFHRADQRQTGTFKWGVIGAERQVLGRGIRSPFGLGMFQKGKFGGFFKKMSQKTGRGSGVGMARGLGSRSFITANIFENAIIQANLQAELAGFKGIYSAKQKRAMAERFWRISKVRGGDVEAGVGKAFKKYGVSSLDDLAKMAGKDLTNVAAGASAHTMPKGLANLLKSAMKHEKYGRLFAGAARWTARAMPLVSAYFTFKLVSDIAEWGTKKIMRGLNWYYFKMPMQIYRAGTQGLRRPIMGAGTFVDSPGAQTERQRAVQAIQNSRMNARSALSAEAGLMHEYFG